jgi:hypothetical protein
MLDMYVAYVDLFAICYRDLVILIPIQSFT